MSDGPDTRLMDIEEAMLLSRENGRKNYRPGLGPGFRADGKLLIYHSDDRIAGGIGAAFFIVGTGMFMVPAIRNGSAAKLRETGQLVQSRCQGVKRNERLVMNGKNPYQIVCQWQNPVTSDLHVFRSDNLWFDPSRHIFGESIPVYINPTNPRKYWVDTSFLPELAS